MSQLCVCSLNIIFFINNTIINYLVVNPNVRLTWIQENWGSEDPHYKKAVKTIKKLVHTTSSFIVDQHLICNFSQMGTYQGNAPEKRSIKKNIPPSPAKCLNKWQQIVNKYENQLSFQPTFSQAIQTIEDEFASYTASCVVQTDILQFWQVCTSFQLILLLIYWYQANERTYPTIFKIAMDFLPIQASAVPCEHIFSSSSETDTKK